MSFLHAGLQTGCPGLTASMGLDFVSAFAIDFDIQGERPPHLKLYAAGAFKLANVLVNLGITAYPLILSDDAGLFVYHAAWPALIR